MPHLCCVHAASLRLHAYRIHACVNAACRLPCCIHVASMPHPYRTHHLASRLNSTSMTATNASKTPSRPIRVCTRAPSHAHTAAWRLRCPVAPHHSPCPKQTDRQTHARTHSQLRSHRVRGNASVSVTSCTITTLSGPAVHNLVVGHHSCDESCPYTCLRTCLWPSHMSIHMSTHMSVVITHAHACGNVCAQLENHMAMHMSVVITRV